MRSQVRDYVQDEPMYRAVLCQEGKPDRYRGPYRTIGPARSQVTYWAGKADQEDRYGRDIHDRSGHVEVAEPLWERVP